MEGTEIERPNGYPGNLTPEQAKVYSDYKTALSRRFSSPTYDDIPVSLDALMKAFDLGSISS